MRMRKPLMIAVILASLHAGVSAQGPSRLTRHAERADASDVTRIWAGCVADIERDWARSLLETLPTTAAESTVWSKHEGYNDRCLTNNDLLMYGKQVTFTSEMARGEIARNLVRYELRKQDRVPTPGSGTAWLRARLAALPAGATYNRSTLVGHQFALCVADEHWAATRAFVEAQHGSKSESAALNALLPKMSGCMPAGVNIKLTPQILRLLLSEGAYHALTTMPTGMAR